MFSKSALVLAAFVTIAAGVTSANAVNLAAAPVAKTVAVAPAVSPVATATPNANWTMLPAGTIVFHKPSGSGCTLNGNYYSDGETVKVQTIDPNGNKKWINVVCVGGVGWAIQ